MFVYLKTCSFNSESNQMGWHNKEFLWTCILEMPVMKIGQIIGCHDSDSHEVFQANAGIVP
jgi:hypothetical protein